jgi:hypothetical protein
MTNAPSPPHYVTRFYGNRDFALDVIANRQITFVHVSTLNDPFDPYFFLETDFENNRELLLKHIAAHHPQDADWFEEHITEDSWQDTMQALEAFYQKLKTTSFVFSTSAENADFHPKDNLYMWGHYGNGHRGVAIEFDTRKLTDSILKHLKTLNGDEPLTESAWCKIEYRKSLSPITAEAYYDFMKPDSGHDKTTHREPTALEQRISLMSHVKGDVWERENEWRLMWSSTTRMKIFRCPISPASIKAIIIGLNAGDETEKNFSAEAAENFPTAEVFRARKRLGDLALDFCKC